MCTCDEALELISARLDGPLTAAEEARLNEHLAACPPCRALLVDLEDIHGAMPALWAEPPADLKDRVMDRVRADGVTPLSVQRPRRRWRGWAALAAVCAVAILGAGSLRYLGLGGGNSGGAAPPAVLAGSADMAAPQEAPAAAPEPALPEARAGGAEDGGSLDSAAKSNDICVPGLQAEPAAPAGEDMQPRLTTTSLLPPEDEALETLFQFLGGEAVYTAAPLPNGEVTGLLLVRTGGAPEDAPAYAALVYAGETPADSAQGLISGRVFHFHTYLSEDFSPDACEDAYRVYTVWPGDLGIDSETVPAPVPAPDQEALDALQEKYGLTPPPICGNPACAAILEAADGTPPPPCPSDGVPTGEP